VTSFFGALANIKLNSLAPPSVLSSQDQSEKSRRDGDGEPIHTWGAEEALDDEDARDVVFLELEMRTMPREEHHAYI
jgi:hypothetical protein